MPGTQKSIRDRRSLGVTGEDEWPERRAGQARGERLEHPDGGGPPGKGYEDPNDDSARDVTGVVGSHVDPGQAIKPVRIAVAKPRRRSTRNRAAATDAATAR